MNNKLDVTLAKCLARVITDLALYLVKEEGEIVTQQLGAGPEEAWKSQEGQASEGATRSGDWKSQEGQPPKDWKPQERQSSRPPRTIEGWEENLIPTAKLNKDD